MADHEVERASTTEGLPVAPSMGPALEAAAVPARSTVVDRRVVVICGLCIALAVVAAFVAQALVHLIGFVTNLAFYGRLSFEEVAPTTAVWGAGVMIVPVIGGLIVGLMARYGSKAIRGHGIPEAMEQVLTNESRIPARMTFLKPLSSAIAIGTGGPFGAEGPIIATGGAMGSLIGQLLHTTADERKTLLAAGAAAGMAATFGAPVSAVLLAVELLLFEFRPRSMIPVALAAATAAGARIALEGAGAVFAMPDLLPPPGPAMGFYIALGAVIGVASVLVTRIVYAVEDAFEHLPIHWMWWPAFGGGLGFMLGMGAAMVAPVAGIDPRIAALVGMAAIFAGASRSMLASAVFAFETTLQPMGLLPLLGGCASSYLVASLLMRNSIMTEKIARRGVRVPAEYAADFLDQVLVREMASTGVVTLQADDRVDDVRAWVAAGGSGSSHQGFPVVEPDGALLGVVTRREFLNPVVAGTSRVRELIRRPPSIVYDDSTLRDAADHMVNHDIGRLPVVSREQRKLVGMITRSDLLRAHRRRLRDAMPAADRGLLPRLRWRRARPHDAAAR